MQAELPRLAADPQELVLIRWRMLYAIPETDPRFLASTPEQIMRDLYLVNYHEGSGATDEWLREEEERDLAAGRDLVEVPELPHDEEAREAARAEALAKAYALRDAALGVTEPEDIPLPVGDLAGFTVTDGFEEEA